MDKINGKLYMIPSVNGSLQETQLVESKLTQCPSISVSIQEVPHISCKLIELFDIEME